MNICILGVRPVHEIVFVALHKALYNIEICSTIGLADVNVATKSVQDMILTKPDVIVIFIDVKVCGDCAYNMPLK